MATATEEEVDYESDPEEAKRSLAMRRREASDDEEGEGEGGEGRRTTRRMRIHSDDSDDQGGAAEYDDEDELGEEVDEEEVGEGVEDVDEGAEVDEEEDVERYGDRKLGGHVEIDAASGNAVNELEDDGRSLAEGQTDLQEENLEGEFDEEKKVNEPFAVPTAGAFYMHDDRFRDNAGGRHRYSSRSLPNLEKNQFNFYFLKVKPRPLMRIYILIIWFIRLSCYVAKIVNIINAIREKFIRLEFCYRAIYVRAFDS